MRHKADTMLDIFVEILMQNSHLFNYDMKSKTDDLVYFISKIPFWHNYVDDLYSTYTKSKDFKSSDYWIVLPYGILTTMQYSSYLPEDRRMVRRMKAGAKFKGEQVGDWVSVE